MAVSVPSNYVWWVQAASRGTGLPYNVVAAQITVESGFDPSAVSPAGAEGIAQFLPSTFYGYSSGSPFNVNDALRAYINFMSYLLRLCNGNVRSALAAYNAGPGDIPAGYSYAQEILNLAGEGSFIVSTTGRLVEVHTPDPTPPDWADLVLAGAGHVTLAGRYANEFSRMIGRL